ncbi:MAG: hypothetical protein K6D98_00075 [Clostridiales bacterium]|nr:hypothetical protein [Clostridiales bacterium]
MKQLKKLGALLLVLVITAAISVTVFAAADNLTDGVFGAFNPADTVTLSGDEAIIVLKELVSTNADASTVNAPTISYTYAITAATGGDTITDATSAHDPAASVTVTTKPGVTTGLSYTTSLSWTPAETLTDGSNYKNIEIDFSGVNFGAAGVYRYVITEKPANQTTAANITAAYAAAGVTETTGTHVRYLDVYVKPSATYTGAQGADDWDVYGYVCFTNDNDIDATDTGSVEPAVSAAVKTNGFVEASSASVAADIYYSFNVTISKTVQGDTYLQATHAKFPFTVAFENATVTQNVLPIVSVNNASYATVGTALTAGNINAITAHDPTIGHAGSVTYTGVPSGTKITVYETNNQVGTTYNVSTTGGDTNLTNESVANPNNSGNAIANAQTALVANTDETIAFTNSLLLISPTGYVARIAPYAMIFGGGIALLVLSKKYKREEEEEA